MHQSSSLTSYRVLTEIGRQECNWFRSFVSAPKVTTKSNWLQSTGGGVGSTQCLYMYNNGRLFLPSTPICNHRETVITFNITYAHFNGVAFTTSYFKDKAHKVLHQIFAIVSFFSILFHFFPSFFFSFLKKGWLWWWCSRLVIEMQLLNLGNPFYL